MASNASTLEDPDYGRNADWIELYNESPISIDLSGYFLSDNLGNPLKWEIPLGTIIDANAHLLFWADGEDNGIHCNFELSKDEGAIGIYNPDGLTLDSIIYSNQKIDISYGRASDGINFFGHFSEPSPSLSNGGPFYENLVYNEPKFSTKGGLFTSSVELALSSLQGSIYYTLDGTEPNTNSAIYTNPISINVTTVVRARVIIEDQLPGEVVTHSYFFNEDFEARGLPVVSIVTNPDHFWDPAIGLYMQDFKPEWEYPINVELFENDGHNQALFNKAAGIKINGNNSWQFPQKILGLYFRNDYGPRNVAYPVFHNIDRSSYDYLVLRASGNDQGNTFFVDGLAQALLKDNMNFDLVGFRPASVFVNGEYLGLHNIRSKQNEEYFEYHYDLDRGEYDLIFNDGEVDEGDDIAYQDLFARLNQDLSIQSNYDAVAEVMDMDNLIDYFISEIWLSNRSWGHNIKLFKPKASGSKWKWIFKDVDRGFSGVGNNGISYFIDENISPTNYEYARVVLRQLFQNDAFVDLFIKRFTDHLYTTFHPNRLKTFIEEKATAIENEIPFHLQVWGGAVTDYGPALPSEAVWRSEIEYLNSYAIERASFVYRDIMNHFGTETTSVLGLVSLPAEGGQVMFNGLNVPEPNWAGRYIKNNTASLEVKANIGYEFQGWSLGTYATLISKSSEWKYLDDGIQVPQDWTNIGFNDASWNQGLAQLGYGDGDEQTVISYGNDPNNKHITAYFRKTFTIDDPALYTGQIMLNVLKDEGAVIYLNGTELIRLTMPAGTINNETLAYHTVGDPEEDDFHLVVINTDQLIQGENVIAVEVHQRDASSSDLSFDLELNAVKLNGTPTFSNNETLDLTLPTDIIMIANFESTGACLLPETIAEDRTLSIDCSPYYAIGDVTILPDVALSIDPGVQVIMPNGASIIVNGELQVNGTSDQAVLFSLNETTGGENWGNLRFEHASGPSNLSYLILKDASKGAHPIRDNAAISSFYSELNLNNVTINEVDGNLVFGQYSTIQISDCTFESTHKGNLIEFQHGTGSIIRCDIKGNSKKEVAAIKLKTAENVLIYQNKIYDFLGSNNHGIDFSNCSGIQIENNFIHNCTDKGILSSASFSTIINNTLVNCKEGIAVKKGGLASINKNTFYGNEIGIRCFEKNLGSGGGNADIKNCILSNSYKSAIDKDEKSSININYSFSDTDTLDGNNNLFGNPLFINPTQNNFQLANASPCNNTGTNGGAAVNMGTDIHEFTARPDLLISGINYNPIEGDGAEFIEIFNASDSLISLLDYKISEAVSFTFTSNEFINPGESILIVNNKDFFIDESRKVFEWKSGKLDNGGETIQLKDADGIVIDQVDYDDDLPWPLEADGLGAYLTLISPDLDNHFVESWELSEITIATTELQESNQSLILFPNPANKAINVSIIGEDIQVLEIFNSLGQLIIFNKMESPQKDVRLDVSTWSKGIYFLRANEHFVHRFTVN